MIKHTLFILVFLSLLAVASSELDIVTYPTTGTFTAYSSTADISVCQCSSVVDSIVVENTGVYASRYTISSNQPQRVSLGFSSFDLNPGQSLRVPVSLSAPCGEEDTIPLSYTVTDIFGNVAVLEKDMVVGPCQNLMSSLIVENVSSINPCQPLDYTLRVTNTGTFTEEYAIVFGGPDFENYFTDPYRVAHIDPGQTVDFTDTLTLDCALYGDFTIPFGVEAVNNELVTEFASELLVEQNYPFELTLSPSSLCLDEDFSFTLGISPSELGNNYTVSVSGPEWLSANTSSLRVEKGEQGLVLFSGKPDTLGEFPINITVSGLLGDVTKTISDVLVVDNCYDLDVFFETDRNIVDCAGTHYYPVVVNNTGTVEVPVRLDILGHESFSLSEQNFDLAPHESRRVDLVVHSTDSFTAKAEVLAGIIDKGTYADDSIDVTMRSEYECYEVELVKDTYKALYSDNDVYFQLQQVGLVGDTYDVSFQANPFLSFGLASDPVEMTPGFVLNLPIGMHADASAALSAYGGYVIVKRTAWDNSTMTYELPFTLKLSQKSIFVRGYEYFSTHTCHFVSLVLLILIVLSILVLVFRKKVRRVTRGWLILFLLGVWLLIAIVGLSVFGTPHLYDDLPQSNDSLEFIIGEDTFLTLNAADYFVDPDNNSLMYDVTEMENITTVIDGSYITFTPEGDFSGERRFRISANDGLDTTRGDRMTLTVVDRPEYSAWDLYTRYCFHVNLVLLAILFLFLFFVCRKRVRRTLSATSSSTKTTSKPVAKKKVVKKTAKKKTTKKRVVKKKTAKKKAALKKVKK